MPVREQTYVTSSAVGGGRGVIKKHMKWEVEMIFIKYQ